jgi:hypothetical protein
MFGQKFLDQGLHLRKLGCARKDFLLLGRKMNRCLLFELPRNLRLPRLEINLGDLASTRQPDTQSQAVLVLSGKGNEILVAQHEP